MFRQRDPRTGLRAYWRSGERLAHRIRSLDAMLAARHLEDWTYRRGDVPLGMDGLSRGPFCSLGASGARVTIEDGSVMA
jgi:hypothetical protein